MEVKKESAPSFSVPARRIECQSQAAMVGHIGAAFRKQGIDADPVLDAMRQVPRKEFLRGKKSVVYDPYGTVLVREKEHSFRTTPPIFAAYMLHLLGVRDNSEVLEIGTGSAWLTAVVSRMVKNAGQVVSIDDNHDRQNENEYKLFPYKNYSIATSAYSPNVKELESPLVGGTLTSTLKTFDRIIFWAAVQPEELEAAYRLLGREDGVMVYPTVNNHALPGQPEYGDGLARPARHTASVEPEEMDGRKALSVQRWRHVSSEMRERLAEKGIFEPIVREISRQCTQVFENVMFRMERLALAE